MVFLSRMVILPPAPQQKTAHPRQQGCRRAGRQAGQQGGNASRIVLLPDEHRLVCAGFLIPGRIVPVVADPSAHDVPVQRHVGRECQLRRLGFRRLGFRFPARMGSPPFGDKGAAASCSSPLRSFQPPGSPGGCFGFQDCGFSAFASGFLPGSWHQSSALLPAFSLAHGFSHWLGCPFPTVRIGFVSSPSS